jgi:hypothetical protein
MTLYRWIKSGKIEAVTIDGKQFFSRTTLARIKGNPFARTGK